MITRQIAFPLLLTTLVTSFAAGQDWNQFRGPHSNGHANASNLPAEFGEQENLQWKISLPGRAWSSPVVNDDQVWLTTAIEIEATGEEKKEMLKAAKIGGMSAFSNVKLIAICVDRKTGATIHQKELFDIKGPPLINSLNSFSSPTPVVDADHVYCNFGTFGTVCLNRKDASEVWRNSDYKIDHQTGPGSSPLLFGDNLYINYDGTDKQFVVALNTKTGKEVWQTKRSGKLNDRPDMQKAFTTPLIVKIDGKNQLVSPGADWVYSYDPADGKELWKVKFGQLGFSNAPQPVFAEDKIIICTGFMRSQMLAIDMQSGRPQQTDIAWRYRRQVPSMPTPIAVKDRIYFVSDRGIATCLDASDGSQKWQQRLGGDFSSSPIFADGKLFFASRKGIVFVIEPGDEFKLRAENQLDSRVMATPVASGRSLFVRTEKSLYHFAKK